jgi:recombination associated protein RdgC
MTQWLASGEAPAGFTLDDICELRGSGDGKSSVRYTGDIPEAGEIRKHIESGKQVTKLALTWRDKISFVLDEHGQIKRLRPLDVLTEQADADDEVFDSDFALMSGELGKLLTDLVSALGGETESP